MSGLPNWVWDLVADLLDEEDVHPKLFVEAFSIEAGKHVWTQYDWCPAKPLARVPDDVKAHAAVIANYRQRGEVPSGLSRESNDGSSERPTGEQA